ncbi:putative NAD-specific glutamate dehydrogenase [Maritimibacter alkaliphilus HTCC2654]|uniref:Putative NAD-specific glutamate dehydrogenase n=1 Tax=Maritimibacter alkaliphilus HTCC2654 TaxID=314271 RepID=A3VD25_9RHOB|nr:putative NAD-specific glutamate dehydrogenase [Maritimibacter alkaliphilus HTCC2654]
MDARLDLVGVVGLQLVLERGDGQFDGFHRGGVDLVAMLFERLLGRVHKALGLVLGFDQLAAALVGFGVRLGVLDHLFDLVVRQTARRLNRDLLFLVGALVLGPNRHDAVGVDVEGHFDLRHTARCRGDVFEVELTEDLVVRSHFTLALEHPDRHGVLVVFRGREDLRLFRRDRRVAVDQAGEHAAQRFDAERQRGHVEQDDVFHVTLQNARLNGGAEGHHFVRVHTLVRLFPEELGHLFNDLRHTRLTADEDDFVDLVLRHARVFQSGLTGLERVLDEIADKAFQLRTGQFHDHVERLTVRTHRDERLVDLGLGGRRKLDLGLFRSFLEPLEGHLVFRQVDVVLFLELFGEVVDDPHVEVFTAEERVAVGGFHFEQAIVDLKDRDVERTAAKVIDRDRARLFLVETIGKRSRRRFVDDAQHFQTGDLAGVLRGLTLGVVEVGGHGDDGLIDLFTKIAFRRFLHLAEDEGRNLRRRILFTGRFDPRVTVAAIDDGVGDEFLVLLDSSVTDAAADQAFHGEDGVVGVGDSLTLGRLTDEAFLVFESDDRRGRPCTFGVFDDPRLRAVHDGDAGVGGPQVDTNDFTHALFLSLAMCWALARKAPSPDPIR